MRSGDECTDGMMRGDIGRLCRYCCCAFTVTIVVMVDGQQDPILNYRGIPPQPDRSWDTPEYRRWRRWRGLFRVGVVLAMTPVAFYFGPNLINYGKLTSLTPADFVQRVERLDVPTVRAMKEFERDTGHLPDSEDDLVPKYLASIPNDQHVSQGYFTDLDFRGVPHFITYDFTPGAEAWRVDGPDLKGLIPVPPVTIGPGTRSIAPTTR